jgi:hypothetical protein
LSRLTRLPGHTHLRRLPRPSGLRLIWPDGTASEDWHDDKPAVCELVIPNDSITVGPHFARASESLEDRVSRYRPVENLARRIVLFALLREDGDVRIHGLHNVIGPDRKAVIRRVALRNSSLRTFKARAETVEALDQHDARLSTLCALFNCRRARWVCYHRPDNWRGGILPLYHDCERKCDCNGFERLLGWIHINATGGV